MSYTRVKPNVDRGLGVIMACQCVFISYNTCHLVQGADSRGGYVCGGQVLRGNSLLSAQFFSEPKTV